VKSLNVIGCGKVGKTLSRLWSRHDVFKVQNVLNRSLQSAAQAVDFVGSGRAVDDFAQLQKADVVMISASDESIGPCCRRLAATDILDRDVVVFHSSGSLSSHLLEPARKRGASVASIHPIKSCADPAASAETFAGTYCAIEGDPAACDVLRDALERCGAITFPLDPKFKTIHHAACVMVCNYLVALMETGLRCFEKGGIPRDTAMDVMKPIVTGTVDNVFRLGPVAALTGPIARGDRSVVQRHCEALSQWDEDILEIYKGLGRVAVELSATQGNASADALAAIEKMLHD